MNWPIAALAVVMVAACGGFYYAYWAAWSWVWSYVWPTGPVWWVQPSLHSFLAISFTMVIISLMLLKGSE
jgi:hypothetical protein